MSKLSLIAIAIAALAASPAFAADAPKQKAAAKTDCYEAATMPKAKSEKDRAAVKEAAKGAGTECYDEKVEPDPKSTKSRTAVKEETKRAVKAGEIPSGEAMQAEAKKKQ